MSLYTCRTTEQGYRIAKFDSLLNVLAVYDLINGNCRCFQGQKPTCRHREMVERFMLAGRVNKGWFYDWEGQAWVEPIYQEETLRRALVMSVKDIELREMGL